MIAFELDSLKLIICLKGAKPCEVVQVPFVGTNNKHLKQIGMYELKNGVVCIPAKALYEDLKIINFYDYQNFRQSKRIELVQRGGNGRKALLAYESLPPDVKEKLIDEIGKPTEEDQISRVEFFYKEEVKTRDFFENYRLPDGRYLTPADQDEYTANVTMLLALEEAVNETKITRSSRTGSNSADWKALTKIVTSLKHKKVGDDFPYKHTLPTSERRLRDALKNLQKNGCESVIRLGKYNNKNASKIMEKEQEYVLQEMIANGRNLDNETIANLYNAAAKTLGWATITGSAIGVWRKKLKRVTEAGRRGASHYNNTLAMQNKRSRPSAPLYFWSADGWTVELFYQARNKSGVKTYTNRLTAIIILDAFNYYPIGYAIGNRENADLIEEAIRNAVNHTKELFGQRYRTWQIQSDNYQKKRLAPYWEALGDKWTPARVGNAKSKPIEAWFKHEMQKRCQLSEYRNWSGYGVTSKADNQVNDDWLNANKVGFPTREGCFSQITRILESIRSEKRAEFVAAFNALPQEDKLPLSEELYLYKFGHKTLPNKLEGQGLTPRINGVEHFFDSYDLNFRNHSQERWIVYYDPDDKTKALAVADGKEELRFMVEEKYIQPMALKDRKEGDAEALARVRKYNQQDRDYIIEERAKGAEYLNNLLARHKELDDGLLAKLLITDSKGQHKNHTFQDVATEAEYEHVGASNFQENEYLKKKADLSSYFE